MYIERGFVLEMKIFANSQKQAADTRHAFNKYTTLAKTKHQLTH